MFMQNTLTRFMRLPLISVALVQGWAMGGGAELTTACDFRLMTEESVIRFVHKEMGIVPSWVVPAGWLKSLAADKLSKC